MRIRGRTFALNKQDGKALGVCAGLADMTGIDATIIRICMVVATLMLFPWVPIAYVAAALFAKKGAGSHSLADHRLDERHQRVLDLRMQAIETCSASQNSELAREIEALR